MIEDGTAPKPGRGPLKWLVRLGLGLLILALLLGQRGMAREVGTVFSTVPPTVVALSVCFYWLGQLFSAWKWQLLLSARGVPLSLAQCSRFYVAGMFGNLWLPTNIGGDGLRAYMVTRARPEVSLADAAASVLVERLTGFAALLFIAGSGILVGGLRSGQGLSIFGSGLLVLVVAAVLWKALGRLSNAANPLARKLGRLRQAVDFYLKPQQRPTLHLALLLSLVFQVSQVLLNIFLAAAVGLDLPWTTYFWLCPLLALSGLLPIGIGGLGVREAAAVALLGGSSAGSGGVILSWSLLWQVTVWLSSLPGGLFLKTKPPATR